MKLNGVTEQSREIGRTEGSYKKDGSDEEEKIMSQLEKKEKSMMEMMNYQGKKTKEMVMELMNVVMEIMVLVVIVKNPVPMKTVQKSWWFNVLFLDCFVEDENDKICMFNFTNQHLQD
jgi:hypothetical protein